MTTLALRNNNPGNIRPSSPPWLGVIGENGGFAVFDTLEHGIRALAKQLMVYQDKYKDENGGKINTVKEAISRWAPGNENNTVSYTSFVCHVLNCNPDDEFDFHNADFLFWMVTAIGEEESGHDVFTHGVSDAAITAGVAAALGA